MVKSDYKMGPPHPARPPRFQTKKSPNEKPLFESSPMKKQQRPKTAPGERTVGSDMKTKQTSNSKIAAGLSRHIQEAGPKLNVTDKKILELMMSKNDQERSLNIQNPSWVCFNISELLMNSL